MTCREMVRYGVANILSLAFESKEKGDNVTYTSGIEYYFNIGNDTGSGQEMVLKSHHKDCTMWLLG